MVRTGPYSHTTILLNFSSLISLLNNFIYRPALRERLVFHHKCYSDGALSRAYTSHIRFHWPFPDALIMANDCKLSDLFEHYAFDINNWAMEEEFFTELAEMREDIPSVKIFK